jgi:hypothetical protein
MVIVIVVARLFVVCRGSPSQLGELALRALEMVFCHVSGSHCSLSLFFGSLKQHAQFRGIGSLLSVSHTWQHQRALDKSIVQICVFPIGRHV